MPTQQNLATSPVTLETLAAQLASLLSDHQDLQMRMTALEARYGPPSSSPQAPQSTPPPAVTQQQLNSPVKKKRNERTRQQHKRRATRVTMQSSVKEVKHTKREPGKHVVLQRIKLIPWDWGTTSLWCWHAVISWNGMTMMLWCGASGMPRIGIG